MLKSQGLVYHQSVTTVIDGGDTVRSWPQELHPWAEHVIDWFHIAMRFTALKQMMAKSIQIQDADPKDPDNNPGRFLDCAKWSLWHGNVHRSLERLYTLIELIKHDPRVQDKPERQKLARTLNELTAYLDSNRQLTPNYWGRRRRGEAISS